MEIICVIPARSGSKGITNKNIINFNGKPLIAWTIEAALKVKKINRIIVSTDSHKISLLAKKLGAEVPNLRPRKLAMDHVHASNVVLHTLKQLKKIENYNPKAVMMLLPTSPLRKPKNINDMIKIFENKMPSSIISVEKLRKYENNLRYIVNGKLTKLNKKNNLHQQRQGQKSLYGVNGSIFLASTKKFLEKKTFHLEGAIGYEMDSLSSIDINSYEDLNLANKYYKLIKNFK